MKLFKVTDNECYLVGEKIKADGSLTDIIRIMLKCGIEENEILLCLSTMIEYNHSIGHFGLSGRFMYTK